MVEITGYVYDSSISAYICDTSLYGATASFVFPGGIEGAQGTQGTQGVQGIQGITGSQGVQGITGSQGTQGTQGIQGRQGVQGIQGITGSQGTQGIQGVQGITGSQGTQGIQGVQGIQGIQGISFSDASLALYVKKTGDTMTGALTINASTHISGSNRLYFGTTPHSIYSNDAQSVAIDIGTNQRFVFNNGRLMVADYADYGIPSLSGMNYPNTGLGVFGSTANQLSLMTAGLHRVVVNAAGNVGIGTATPSTRLHLAGNTTAHYAEIDTGVDFVQVPRPTAILDVSILAVAGNVDGTHHYVYSFVTPIGETKVHGVPNGPHVFVAATNGQAAITVPIATDYRVTSRKIYRTLDTTYPYTLYYCGTIPDNTTTTFIDNVSDGGLGTVFAWYRPDTTNAMIKVNGVDAFFTDDFLTSVGVGAGRNVKAGGGYINTMFGTGAGQAITSGSFNTLLGYGTLSNDTTGNGNVAVGEMAGYDCRGSYNIIMGDYTFSGITGTVTGNGNVVIGHGAAYSVKGQHDSNVIIGSGAGYNGCGSRNIFLGLQAGYYETGSGKLIIDNTARASEDAQRSEALIYGVMSAPGINQTLSLGGGGNVGIGTISPTNDLHIYRTLSSGGFAGVGVSETANNKRILSGIYNGGAWDVGGMWMTTDAPTPSNAMLLSDGGNTYFNAPTGSAIYFGINNAYKINISAAGYVAIGRGGNFAEYQLDVSGHTRIDGSLNLTNHLTLTGAGTVWNDLRFPATTTKQGATNKPAFDYTNVGLLFPQNDETEIIYINAQFNHDYKLGSTISPHIHYVQTSSAKPTFVMKYRWYDNGDDVSIAYTIIEGSTNVATYTSGSILQIIDFPDIAGTGITGLSSMMDIQIYRKTGDGVTGNVLVKEFDIHYEADSLGSNEEYIK